MPWFDEEKKIINDALAIFVGSVKVPYWGNPNCGNYCTSSNHMHKVESKIAEKNLIPEYLEQLISITNTKDFPTAEKDSIMSHWHVCHASPIDRATAAYMVIKQLLFCGNCEHLNFTETGQAIEYENTGKQPAHICNKYNERVTHRDYRPNLLKLSQCEK